MRMKICIIVFCVFTLIACKHSGKDSIDAPDAIAYNKAHYYQTSIVYESKGYPNSHIRPTDSFTKDHKKIYIQDNSGFLYLKTDGDIWVQYKK